MRGNAIQVVLNSKCRNRNLNTLVCQRPAANARRSFCFADHRNRILAFRSFIAIRFDLKGIHSFVDPFQVSFRLLICSQYRSTTNSSTRFETVQLFKCHLCLFLFLKLFSFVIRPKREVLNTRSSILRLHWLRKKRISCLK